MAKRDGVELPLEDWMVWMAVRDARLSPAGLEAIRSLLVEKESQLREPLPGTPLTQLSPDLDAE